MNTTTHHNKTHKMDTKYFICFPRTTIYNMALKVKNPKFMRILASREVNENEVPLLQRLANG